MGLKPAAVFENLHLPEIMVVIRNALRGQAGIYMIINLNTAKFYIGSAVTGYLYARFHAHLISLQGSKLVRNVVNRSGLENFAFVVLEYFPDAITASNKGLLLGLETGYIHTLNPQYNILKIAGNSFGYNHTERTKKLIKDNYSQERRDQVGALNRGKSLSSDVRAQMRDKAKVGDLCYCSTKFKVRLGICT